MRVRHTHRVFISVNAGFTLLEVMIAVVILAIGLTTLFGSQSQSVSLAGQAKFNTIAPQLARLKLSELKSQQTDIASDNGEFAEEFNGYSWKIEVEESIPGESELLSIIAENIQKVTLTISFADNSHQYMVESYFLKKPIQ